MNVAEAAQQFVDAHKPSRIDVSVFSLENGLCVEDLQPYLSQ